MATGKMRYYSLAQAGQTNFRYVLPCDVPPEMVQGNRHFNRPAKNLYLLHGFSGNEDDWEYNGVAEDIAVEYNLNVFMVSAETVSTWTGSRPGVSLRRLQAKRSLPLQESCSASQTGERTR